MIDTGIRGVVENPSTETEPCQQPPLPTEQTKLNAKPAVQIQDAVNLTAIVGAWHRHLLAMHRENICGDRLINHPVNLAFVSKLNSLCRMTVEREAAALSAIDKIERGEAVQYDVIPL